MSIWVLGLLRKVQIALNSLVVVTEAQQTQKQLSQVSHLVLTPYTVYVFSITKESHRYNLIMGEYELNSCLGR